MGWGNLPVTIPAMPPMRKAVWYFDSVTLSNFALAHHLDLLLRRYPAGRLCVTAQVVDEVLGGIQSGHGALKAILTALERGMISQVSLTPPEFRRYQGLLTTLGAGEASLLAVVARRSGTVVTDDRHARLMCRELRLPVTGTLGILKAASGEGMLTVAEADAILGEMIRQGFYSPVRKLAELD
jgi:predicted nucleic acid-binding protein